MGNLTVWHPCAFRNSLKHSQTFPKVVISKRKNGLISKNHFRDVDSSKKVGENTKIQPKPKYTISTSGWLGGFERAPIFVPDSYEPKTLRDRPIPLTNKLVSKTALSHFILLFESGSQSVCSVEFLTSRLNPPSQDGSNDISESILAPRKVAHTRDLVAKWY